METPRDRDDRLAAELRALRPAPRPEFTAKLDERAAAGFPRRSRMPRLSFGRLRSIPARRMLLPASGFAVLAIAVTTAVVAINDTSGESDLLSGKAPQREADQRPPVTFEKAVPIAPTSKAPAGATEASRAASNLNFDGSGDYTRANAPLNNRAVERSAEITLAADPADVAEDSAKVFDVVGAHDGIVISSSTREGAAGEAGASFELLIPSQKLGDALADFSAIDEVRSRHESTADITAPTVNAGELLRDSNARIDSLLGQLQEAETESEREAVEAELRQERRHRALLRTKLQNLQRRADLSRVSLRIETGAAEAPSSGGAWGVDDALGDAGKILAAAAAIAVVSLAILGPIALIALLAWLTHRAWVRRERRRVLG
ncbi:MAG TPA: DUF4349 domain-containing protein [Solirubrobacterales bacterium]|nr:DUF4349 domain-containing protein [Solirubrobacterales bacterium]